VLLNMNATPLFWIATHHAALLAASPRSAASSTRTQIFA
jgi:hypothetical protein